MLAIDQARYLPRIMLSIILFFGIITACSAPVQPSPTVTRVWEVTLDPYLTPTVTQHPPTLTPLPEIPETPVPSATPVTYTIVQGDTMLSIAIRYGITLDELKAANPGVDPRAMSVGALLVIPLKGEVATPAPSLTPVPLEISSPMCYPTGDKGIWCVVLVKNDQAVGFESLSARFSLFSNDGTLQAERLAAAPLNLLKSGESIPLAVQFPAPLVSPWIVRASLEAALPADEGQGRYLEASVQNLQVEIDDSGSLARLTGELGWAEEQPIPRQIWLVLVAFDGSGQVVGVRKLEIPPPCEGSQVGEDSASLDEPAQTTCNSVSFEAVVYSQGTAIQRVTTLVEARP